MTNATGLTKKGQKIITSREKYPDCKPRFDHKASTQYLKDLKMVFDEAKIPLFLFYGTLLGAIREQDYLIHDGDVDTAMFARDTEKVRALWPRFKELGYNMAFAGNFHGRFGNWYICKPGVPKTKVDIYNLFLSRGKRWFIRYINRKGEGPLWHSIPYETQYFENMETIQFKGMDFKVPSPPEEFLEKLWGEWWVPRGGALGIIPIEKFKIGELKDEEK